MWIVTLSNYPSLHPAFRIHDFSLLTLQFCLSQTSSCLHTWPFSSPLNSQCYKVKDSKCPLQHSLIYKARSISTRSHLNCLKYFFSARFQFHINIFYMGKFNWKLWKFVFICFLPAFHQSYSTHIGVKKSISMISNQASLKPMLMWWNFTFAVSSRPSEKRQKFHHISFVFWAVMQRFLHPPFHVRVEEISPRSPKRRIGCERWEENLLFLRNSVRAMLFSSLSMENSLVFRWKFSRKIVEKSLPFRCRPLSGLFILSNRNSLGEKENSRWVFLAVSLQHQLAMWIV